MALKHIQNLPLTICNNTVLFHVYQQSSYLFINLWRTICWQDCTHAIDTTLLTSVYALLLSVIGIMVSGHKIS